MRDAGNQYNTYKVTEYRRQGFWGGSIQYWMERESRDTKPYRNVRWKVI